MGTRDRYGELVDDDEGVGTVDPLHDPLCRAGWLPDAPDGSAVPCLTCRPHLAHRRDALRRQIEGPPRWTP